MSRHPRPWLESPIFDRMVERADSTQTILAAVVADPLPSHQDDREHIEEAIAVSMAEHDGSLCICWVREHITRDVWPPMIGAAMNAASHGMDWSGAVMPSGGGSRNGSKLVRVWQPRIDVAA